MLKTQNIKQALSSIDNRPTIVWTGCVQKHHSGVFFRVVLNKKNCLVTEMQEGRNSMEEPNWVEIDNPTIDKELLSQVLLETLQELNKHLGE